MFKHSGNQCGIKIKVALFSFSIIYYNYEIYKKGVARIMHNYNNNNCKVVVPVDVAKSLGIPKKKFVQLYAGQKQLCAIKVYKSSPKIYI